MLAADAAAQAAGLRVGMPATKAQALVQGLVIQDADPAGDAEALDRLALWMLRRFAPIIAADAPNGIVIDSTGADHLYGDETAMLAALLEKFGSVGLRVRAAIADSWGAAHALARFNARPGYVSEPGKAAGDVAPLPIAALRLAPDMVAAASGMLGFEASATCWRNRARPSRSASVLGSAAGDQATSHTARLDRAHPSEQLIECAAPSPSRSAP